VGLMITAIHILCEHLTDLQFSQASLCSCISDDGRHPSAKENLRVIRRSSADLWKVLWCVQLIYILSTQPVLILDSSLHFLLARWRAPSFSALVVGS
jgi:hypothetical protein